MRFLKALWGFLKDPYAADDREEEVQRLLTRLLERADEVLELQDTIEDLYGEIELLDTLYGLDETDDTWTQVEDLQL